MRTGTRGLATLARLYGVETAYTGMGGERRRAEAEPLRYTLRALGAALDDTGSVTEALRARRAELEQLEIQPVHVAWNGALRQIRVRLAHAEDARAAIVIRLEDGSVVTQPCTARPIDARARAGWQASHALRFDRRVPLGYHQLQVETSGRTFESLVIAAPRHAYVPPDARDWGVFFPLYAIAGTGSSGVGSYTDLRRASDWIAQLGGDFVSTLPLLATFLDAPFEPSPYAPVSRLFWNDVFIDVADVPGSTGPALDAAESRRLLGEPLVDYRSVAARVRRHLTDALERSRHGVRDELRQFAESTPYAGEFAAFRAVCDRRREAWHAWPERMRAGDLRSGDYAPEDFEYHLFAQWQAERQLMRTATGPGADLYLDLPLGVTPDGFDAWRFRDLFADGVSAGAPPDPLFTGGQNWGFRPLQPHALRAAGYTYFIEVLRHHLRHARMLRIDHVMSMYRLFWVPDGIQATRGVYVRYAEDELFAILTLESVRHRAAIVGEDLGTVPAAVRRAMQRHHIQRLHVVQYEIAGAAGPDATQPDEPVVASLNTHDMPLFAGFWRGSDIDDQRDLGLIDDTGHAAAQEQRASLRRSISRMLGAGGAVDPAIARQRLLERLADSPARYVLITLEDLWLEDRPQNVPGTSDERPNWRRRARRSLDEIIDDAAARRMLETIADRRHAVARTDEP